jgi:hypothetical protein
VPGREPADGERAEREERDVPEIQQAGEADDDVQAERHHHVGEGDRHLLHQARLVPDGGDERQERRDREHHSRDETLFRPGRQVQALLGLLRIGRRLRL